MEKITVEEEYKKNPELKKEDVEEFLEWVTTQPHLPKVSEMEAIHFLHSNYFDMEEAKKTAEKYYTYRTQFTELFTDNDVTSEEMQRTHQAFTISCLPKLTPEGYRVIFLRLRITDPAALDFVTSLKIDILEMDSAMALGTCNGYVLLYDMAGTSFAHMMRVSLMPVKHYMAYVQDAMPIRLKVVEHVNIPTFIDKIYAIFRPFMKKELVSILKYRKRLEEAYETVPADCWPKDYPNGTGPTVEELHESSWKRLISRREEVKLEQQTKRTDESKRVSTGKGLWRLLGY